MIIKVTESIQKKYPQAESMRVRNFAAGSVLTGRITGETQVRQSAKVPGRLKVYAQIRLNDGTLKHVRIGGELAMVEQKVGIENLKGFEVTAVVKSYMSDYDEEICFTDEASFVDRNIPSQVLGV